LQIWPKLIKYSNRLEEKFDRLYKKRSDIIAPEFSGWKDMFWSGENVRKCHLKTIDNRTTQKMWLMHINIFPTLTNDFPILGFDIVAGENKITGSFFDYSPINRNHEMMLHFKSRVSEVDWNKPRELPEWAKQIFSDSMIAAGNVREDEIDKLIGLTEKLIDDYINHSLKQNTSHVSTEENKKIQNFYCQQQKLNPHLHRSILSMGISEEDKEKYVNNFLFREMD
jgi:hypothetical protein